MHASYHIGFPEWIIFSAFVDLITPDMKTQCKLSNLILIIMFFKFNLNHNVFHKDPS